MAKDLQNEYRPDAVSPPGDTLQETLDALGMSQSDLAERTGRPLKTINEIIKGKSAITPQTALQLERVLGVPARLWNSREQHYREHLAQAEEEKRLSAHVDWASQFPVRAMAKLGWIQECRNAENQIRELLGFFGIASPDRWQEHCRSMQARKSPAFESEPAAVAAWLRRGEIEARQITCAPYDPARFKQALLQIRGLTVQGPDVFEPMMIRLCAEAGVAVAFVPELPKTRLCGAARWLTPTKALIQSSLRHKSDDRFWFAFFHEAAHVLIHGKRDVFVDGQGDPRDEIKEKEADRFAAGFLIPPAEFNRFLKSESLTAASIAALAERLGIAPGIVVGRLQHDGTLGFSRFNSLKQRFEFTPPVRACDNA